VDYKYFITGNHSKPGELKLYQHTISYHQVNAYTHIHTHYIQMKDIQLTEKVEKDRNCFQIRQVSTGLFYTLQVSHNSQLFNSQPTQCLEEYSESQSMTMCVWIRAMYTVWAYECCDSS